MNTHNNFVPNLRFTKRQVKLRPFSITLNDIIHRLNKEKNESVIQEKVITKKFSDKLSHIVNDQSTTNEAHINGLSTATEPRTHDPRAPNEYHVNDSSVTKEPHIYNTRTPKESHLYNTRTPKEPHVYNTRTPKVTNSTNSSAPKVPHVNSLSAPKVPHLNNSSAPKRLLRSTTKQQNENVQREVIGRQLREKPISGSSTNTIDGYSTILSLEGNQSRTPVVSVKRYVGPKTSTPKPQRPAKRTYGYISPIAKSQPEAKKQKTAESPLAVTAIDEHDRKSTTQISLRSRSKPISDVKDSQSVSKKLSHHELPDINRKNNSESYYINNEDKIPNTQYTEADQSHSGSKEMADMNVHESLSQTSTVTERRRSSNQSNSLRQLKKQDVVYNKNDKSDYDITGQIEKPDFLHVEHDMYSPKSHQMVTRKRVKNSSSHTSVLENLQDLRRTEANQSILNKSNQVDTPRHERPRKEKQATTKSSIAQSPISLNKTPSKSLIDLQDGEQHRSTMANQSNSNKRNQVDTTIHERPTKVKQSATKSPIAQSPINKTPSKSVIDLQDDLHHRSGRSRNKHVDISRSSQAKVNIDVAKTLSSNTSTHQEPRDEGSQRQIPSTSILAEHSSTLTNSKYITDHDEDVDAGDIEENITVSYESAKKLKKKVNHNRQSLITDHFDAPATQAREFFLYSLESKNRSLSDITRWDVLLTDLGWISNDMCEAAEDTESKKIVTTLFQDLQTWLNIRINKEIRIQKSTKLQKKSLKTFQQMRQDLFMLRRQNRMLRQNINDSKKNKSK